MPTSDGKGRSTIKNSADVVFDEATSDWEDITHFAIWDAASGGSLLFYGPFSQSLFIDEGERLTIEKEEITISIYHWIDPSSGRWSTYLQNAVLKHVLVPGQSLTPTTVYVALARSMPNIDDTGDEIDEISGGGYARVATTWNSVQGGFTNYETAYDEATATWSGIKYYVLTDSLTGGNVLCWDDLNTTYNIYAGETGRFRDAAMTGQLQRAGEPFT
jgi:hypothetical protein